MKKEDEDAYRNANHLPFTQKEKTQNRLPSLKLFSEGDNLEVPGEVGSLDEYQTPGM